VTQPSRAARCAATALAAERAGDWDKADELFRECYRLAVSEADVPLLLDALRGVARALQGQCEYDEAEESAALSVEIAELHGFDKAAARGVNALAVLKHTQGDMPAAKPLYEQAIDRARDAGDDELIGLASQNRGVIAHIEGDLDEARILYLEGIGACVRSKDLDRAVLMYNNLGKICTDLSEWQEAELYFARGVEIAERAGNRPMLARLLMNSVEPLIEIAEFQQALRALDRAEPMAEEMQDRELLVMAKRFRGGLARHARDLATAEKQLSQALELSSDTAVQLERGRVLYAIAELRRDQCRIPAARAALREARHLFQSLGAKRDIDRVDNLLISLKKPAPPSAEPPATTSA
jgi:tetratricopeptide (TPR) repeat protein